MNLIFNGTENREIRFGMYGLDFFLYNFDIIIIDIIDKIV